MARTTHLGFAQTNLQRTRVSLLEAPPAPAASGDFPIAGVGASAGGLEAFSEMLAHLPANPGLAVVLVQHLNPQHASALTEVLRRSTAMPVLEARDELAIQRDRVYVIPPNAVLSLSGNTLRLEFRTGGPQRSIDIFLQSLAREQGARAIGVVLSGAATDGTLGLRAIKAAGGITFAQDGSALCDGMPRSAIAAGCVDSILPPDEIARELMRIAAHFSAAGPDPGVTLSPDHLAEICAALRRATGVDFSFHRPDFVGSRVLRRMALRNASGPAAYLERLSAEPGELDGLFEELLMGKSGFFREPGALEYLKTKIYPEMFSTPPERVRAWVPGCAAGEEAYSLVITLLEHFGNSRRPRIDVFGTGVYAPSLEKARAGIYPGSIAAEIAPDRLAGFFNAVGSSYQVVRLLRNACVFGRQNVWQDAPFSRLDLILYRGRLGLLNPLMQARLLRLFHYALKPGGVLVLGATEDAEQAGGLFRPETAAHRIYRRQQERSPGRFSLPAVFEARRPVAPDLGARVNEILLSKCCPAAVAIDSQLNVLHLHGDAFSFLGGGGAGADVNVLRGPRGALALEVRGLIARVEARHLPARGEVRLLVKEIPRRVQLTVLPFAIPDSPASYLVLFEDAPAPPLASPRRRQRGPRVSAGLEAQIEAARREMEAILADHRTAIDKLKEANEAIACANEELQVSNEELQAGYEELQTTSQELATVNEEMQSRNRELSRSQADQESLLRALPIPLVAVGNDLRIRYFSAQAARVFALLPGDIGRPVSDFEPKMDLGDLRKHLEQAIGNLEHHEREVRDAEGRPWLASVRPSRNGDGCIDGAILTLIERR